MAKSKKKISIFNKLRNYFFAGIVVLVPIGFTLYLTIFLISITATLLVTDYYEQGPIRTIGYNDRLKEDIKTFSWAQKYSNPTIISKERIDLQRSKTGTKMFFSFAFPLGILHL